MNETFAIPGEAVIENQEFYRIYYWLSKGKISSWQVYDIRDNSGIIFDENMHEQCMAILGDDEDKWAMSKIDKTIYSDFESVQKVLGRPLSKRENRYLQQELYKPKSERAFF